MRPGDLFCTSYYEPFPYPMPLEIIQDPSTEIVRMPYEIKPLHKKNVEVRSNFRKKCDTGTQCPTSPPPTKTITELVTH